MVRPPSSGDTPTHFTPAGSMSSSTPRDFSRTTIMNDSDTSFTKLYQRSICAGLFLFLIVACLFPTGCATHQRAGGQINATPIVSAVDEKQTKFGIFLIATTDPS